MENNLRGRFARRYERLDQSVRATTSFGRWLQSLQHSSFWVSMISIKRRMRLAFTALLKTAKFLSPANRSFTLHVKYTVTMRILVTGSAGFIGFHMAMRLLDEGHTVIGLDGFTPYYDQNLKRRRDAILQDRLGFTSYTAMLEDFSTVEKIYAEGFDVVCHFAAQAGVRYSLENPRAYIDSNLMGTFNLLELMRRTPPQHALMASTSSVYGANVKVPFCEIDRADHPLTLYAASKKANEEMVHAYSHLFSVPVTMMRFFTVYGSWSRPDMAPIKFASALFEGRAIDVYNHGKMARDFTFIYDLIEAMHRLLHHPPPKIDDPRPAIPGDSLSPVAPWRVVNIGNQSPVNLMDFIAALERAAGREANCHFVAMQPGDVPVTFADTTLLARLTGFQPKTPLDKGIGEFIDWYRSYFGV